MTTTASQLLAQCNQVCSIQMMLCAGMGSSVLAHDQKVPAAATIQTYLGSINTTLPSTTNDDIELRVCGDESIATEGRTPLLN